LNSSGFTSPVDPFLSFHVAINGTGFAGWQADPNGLGFAVDAAGLPVVGGAAGLWDLGIGQGGALGFRTGGGISGGTATVTYEIVRVVPDACTTSILMGIAWASLAVIRRFSMGRAEH
jgi:hypothetical protein